MNRQDIRKVLVVIAVIALAAYLSMGQKEPKVVEKVVEKPVEVVVEKLVPASQDEFLKLQLEAAKKKIAELEAQLAKCKSSQGVAPPPATPARTVPPPVRASYTAPAFYGTCSGPNCQPQQRRVFGRLFRN